MERIAPEVHTTAEVMVQHHLANFSHVHVDDFLLSQDTISRMAVRSAMDRGISQVYAQLVSRTQGEDVFQIKPHSSWKTYRDAFTQLLDQGATLIADGDSLDINRRLDEAISKDASLFIICNKDTYAELLAQMK
ncbi:hypothetical protein G4V62_15920 [Bacillaceae bacterium SIJ1]|uniref:hypothetical protein n=1 Tax=Litoribacterium kuwaitense TaxID=1398745 RepID=UPI0013EC36F1|nr:hypothetical protein [Litoribacterium kuwaitense]NGP46359.1 hypothetical protein [Litoribacterium kuwaitense]